MTMLKIFGNLVSNAGLGLNAVFESFEGREVDKGLGVVVGFFL